VARSILLLCDDRPSHAPNVLEHIRALQRFSRHRVDLFNPLAIARSRLLDLHAYDAVVVHYTVFVLHDDHLSPWFREQLARYDGVKAQFIQDEYRQVEAMTARMRELGIGVVFSSVPTDAVPDVYGDRLAGVDVLPTLTGYVPADLTGKPRPPLAGRELDVVYRGRSIPYWLGRLGQDKVTIGREFLARAASTDLRCDIAWTEADRIYGDAWYRFLGSSRTTLGTESGASIVDFDGTLQHRTESYLREHPTAGFDEVERELLAPFEGNAVIEAISPRVFEAAALGTAMVNFAGRYSDAIEPWTHYVPLEKDFSNFDEVVAAIRDEGALDAMAARAHEDLVASGRYSLERFVADFDRELEARLTPAQHRPRPRFGAAATRRLLALEQLGSPERRAELPPVAAARARAFERTTRRLISRFPALDALAKHADDRLERDLVRIAAASAAHVRELSHFGPPFDVRLELDAGDRRLTLVGTPEPAQDAAERAELRDRVTAAIRAGGLEEIVWDNSAVEGYLLFASIPISSLDIGYHVINGAHRFTALAELAQNDPDTVIAALEPLFRARPPTPVHELDRRTSALLRAVLRPGSTAARATATVGAVATSKELRRLFGAYLASSEARAEAPLDLVLKDFFRLRLVGRSPAALELQGERRLVYRTIPDGSRNGAALDAATVRTLEQIVWDDSPLDRGAYDFAALAVLARRFPDLAVPALERAARGS
jgi:hypothetical protein